MTMPECPRCGRDAAVTSITAPGGGQLYTCWFSHEGEGHISWQTASTSETTISSDGVTAELVDPFEQILRSLPHVLVEYGVLEYRLRLDYPEFFASHVAARGHYLTGSGQATASSVRFAAALLRLDRAGVVTYEMRRATGAWSYNDKVSYWALMPRPPVGAVLTWAAYCEQIGRSADWTDDDKAVVAAMAANAKPAH
jgi:hypothetical protein